jgi:hypothetical protein
MNVLIQIAGRAAPESITAISSSFFSRDKNARELVNSLF